MRRRMIAVALAAVFCLLAPGAYAATEVPDMMTLRSEVYTKHTKGPVEFSHQKHADAYAEKAPELFKDKCGACHHDSVGAPLVGLKPGDDVQKCIECHKKPGEVPRDVKKEWRSKKISREEQKKLELKYHAEAFHENCIGCHRDYDKKNKTRAAPTTCTKCHSKKK